MRSWWISKTAIGAAKDSGLGISWFSSCLVNWAKYRTTKGPIKLHLLLDHDGYLPSFAHSTEGSRHEMTVAKGLPLPKGSIGAMVKAYVDYAENDETLELAPTSITLAPTPSVRSTFSNCSVIQVRNRSGPICLARPGEDTST